MQPPILDTPEAVAKAALNTPPNMERHYPAEPQAR